MRAISACNPIVTAVYYAAMVGILMLSMNPILLLLVFLGILSDAVARGEGIATRSVLRYLLLFSLLTVLNPLFSHNGKTVLFVLNDAPITLEALVYGALAASGLVAVLLLFHDLCEIMTRDRLLYLFGSLSPGTALVLSMGLHYVPMLLAQGKRIAQAQKAAGLARDEGMFDKWKGGCRMLSVLLTRALENGIITADSMAARGYGRGRRSFLRLFRFTSRDGALLALLLSLAALTLIGIGTGELSFACYPTVTLRAPSLLGTSSYIAFGLLALLPTVMTIKERIQWSILQSKI